jgi:hypothetical protein
VLHIEQNHSAILVQRSFHMNIGKEAPARKSNYKRHNIFAETGCICAENNNSGRRASDETVETVEPVRALFILNPHKSTRRADRQLDDASRMTVWRVLHTRLFPAVQISTAAGFQTQLSTASETSVAIC